MPGDGFRTFRVDPGTRSHSPRASRETPLAGLLPAHTRLAILDRPMQRLALYHYLGCPFCALVRRDIDRLGVEVELRDILESSARRRELIDATGRSTVPCLRIESPDGEVRWMHESADIVEYLRGLASA